MAKDKSPAQAPSRSWLSESLQSVLEPLLAEDREAQGRELLRARRVLDFFVAPGLISAKVQQESARPQHVQLEFSKTDDKIWEKVLEQLSGKAYFIARMLAGDFPKELEAVFLDSGARLLPASASEFRIGIDGIALKQHSPAAAAVALKLLDTLDEDPFAWFSILGRGREETIAEIRRLRARNADAKLAFTSSALPPPDIRLTEPELAKFWMMSPETAALRYTIRADELPGSILKWLDPIPLGGFEGNIDLLLEDAYAKIARLAQSFGIGL